MEKKPEGATVQEGQDSFDHYKPAGKMRGMKTIVTGGDSGIGRAAAVMYAMEGADVAIVYLPEEQVDAEKTKQLIVQTGQQCLLIPQDIRDEQGCNRIIETVVQAWGRIDVLVNNASVMYSIPDITDITTAQFDRTIKTNIYGTFFLTRAAVPHIPKGGSIIVTASQVAYAGPPMLVDYSMTKGAQVAMVRCLSNQLLSKGIRVNAVCPGPVWTPLQPAAMDKDQMKEWHNSPAPIGRIGQPSELGPAYVFLASQDGSFISGQSIHVNGGAIVNG
ncbi:putative oxidoreductase [Kockovaella imperatae]|uniref:Putative oxidoreductase n=1 Tax=Kockovaella imperatae TaxID=4999 RepID=A0A1Y1UM94_9TREE|nr:putative oxidoreductase [Kockovaella imperatae]ORX39170.1 putative oxidoreductase [Kockovaella imperatae]